jgi:ABC-type multidrug transport system fused ATPase/permease subunit
MSTRIRPTPFWLVDRSMRQFVWSIVRPYRAAIALILLSGLFSTLAETAGIGAIVLLVNLIIDPQHAFTVTGGGAFARIYSVVADVPVYGLVMALLLFVLARSIALMVYMQQSSMFRHAVSEELRNAIYRRCFEMPYQDVLNAGSGKLTSLVSSDSWSLADACIITVQLIVGLGSVGILVAIMFLLSWPLAMAATGLTLALLAVVHFVWRPANAAGKAVTRANADLHGEMLTGLQSVRTIRAHAQEEAAIGWFAAASRDARQAFIEIDRLYSRIRPFGEVSALTLR